MVLLNSSQEEERPAVLIEAEPEEERSGIIRRSRAALTDPRRAEDHDSASFDRDLLFTHTEGMFPGFSQRDSLPTEAEPAANDRLQELNDVLNGTKLNELALPLVNRIRVTEHDSGRGMAGQFNRKTGNLAVSTAQESKEFLIPAILHELGHAFALALSRDEEVRAIFDRYIDFSQAEDTAHSPYAEFLERNGGKATNNYIEESFAEDFRLFWLKPEDLSAGKRSIFEALMERLILGVPHEEIREGIRSVLGNYYGASVDQLFKEIDCLNAE